METKTKRGDLVRLVHQRIVKGQCLDCAMRFTNTGAAASHARKSRHTVHVDYQTDFTYRPAEAASGR